MRVFEFLSRRIADFRRSEAGNYAIIFALTAFPIMGTASAALEYSNMQRFRGAVQNGLDSAALAAAKEYSNGLTGDALTAYAEQYLEASLPSYVDHRNVDVQVRVRDENVIDANGEPAMVKTVRLDADIHYDSFIAGVLGYDEFDIGVASQVALGNVTVEIALVMDNSGSMGSSRKIQSARSTAKSLVQTIFTAASNSNKPNPVSFSLVPFSGMVNIGSGNAGESWMDTRGWSSIHHENLDWAGTYVTGNQFQARGAGFRERINGAWQWKTRFDIFDMLDVDWKGCVEIRPWPHNTLDTAARVDNTGDRSLTRATKDSEADIRDRLFVPFFAPAEPYSRYAYESSGYYGGSTRYSNDWYNYENDYLNDWVRPRSSNPNSLEQIFYDDGFGSPYNNGVIQSRQNLRQDWVWRYQAAALDDDYASFYGDGTSTGPNFGCVSRPITALTTDKSAIDSEIDRMEANGMTNIQQGVAWGWRTLSPGEPFTGGRDSADETNRKYMIVLTDGNNTYNSSSTPNGSYYGSWGYEKHGRMDQGLTADDLAGTPYVGESLYTFEKKMNAHTVQTCNNAKADGVTVFTIAFDVRDGSSVKEMLEACSGSGIVNGGEVMTSGIFYYDVSASELDQAMASIANQISTMRILR